jgi:pyrroline-5-carboxylate reductase
MTGAILPPLLLLGGGRMGGAMLAGWREQGLAPSVVLDPGPAATSLAAADVAVFAEAAAIPDDFRPEVIVLAVKPQNADAALPQLARFARDALVISVMAGRTLAGLRVLLGEAAMVRAMPNTPAAIRQGFTAAFAGDGVSPARRDLADRLLRAVGEVAWVDAESQLDAVTAVSGGGPAYVFLLAEAMEQAALAQGLPPALARAMARSTVAGSGALLGASTEDAAELRRAVTSPRGTTERALAVLMAEDGVGALMRRAVQAATDRSRELAG